jgi:5'-AMP-activated protein kinase regulatory gamma subunit
MLAAPLWDPKRAQFVGLLTVTDFIDLLRHYKATNKDVGELATESIATILAQHPTMSRPFYGADSYCSLKHASIQLLATGQDFLPICYAEDMRVLACLTYTNILEHLVTHFREQRRLFDDSIMDLGIGTYHNSSGGENGQPTALVTVTTRQTLQEALALMQQHGLSALPVLDGTTLKLKGVYSRSDITFLTKATDAEDAVRNLDVTLADILSQHRHDVTTPDALRTCSPQHTLQAVFESFAQVRFDRLYVVDSEDGLLGVVSAKDLVQYFLKEDLQEAAAAASLVAATPN